MILGNSRRWCTPYDRITDKSRQLLSSKEFLSASVQGVSHDELPRGGV